MIVFLRTRSYNIVGGIHFYGKLRSEGRARDVIKILSRTEARLLNQADGRESYREGDESGRFRSRDRLRLAAVAQYKKWWPAATHLIEGMLPPAEAQLVLDGPGKNELNALYEECELLGWWDKGHIEEVEEICEKWDALLERKSHEAS